MSQTVAAKDVYLDDDGEVTTDAGKAARQIAFKGSVIGPAARHLYHLNEDGSAAKAEKSEVSGHKPDEKKVLTTDSVKRSSAPSKK